MGKLKFFGVVLSAFLLVPQLATAAPAGDPPLSVSDGGTLTVDSAYNVYGNDGITAEGDNNTITITTDGSITSDQNAITTDGNWLTDGQTINNSGTISGDIGINFCFEDTLSLGNDKVVNSGTISGTDYSYWYDYGYYSYFYYEREAIQLGYGDDTIEMKPGSSVNGAVRMGPGDDTIIIDGADDETMNLTVAMGKDNDTIHVKSGNLNLSGNPNYDYYYYDVYQSTDYQSVFGSGDDTLIVDSGATLNIVDYEDFFAGGADTARIYGTVTNKLPGGPGNDTFYIYEGASVQDLCGGSDFDELNLYISGDYDYTIEYFETINKYGTGTLVLTDSSSGYDNGFFTIHEGSVQLDGDFDAEILLVKPGTLLKGSGSSGYDEGDGIVINHGTVSPGNSIGTLTIDNYVQSSTGQLTVEIGGGNSDLLDVGGSADISGTVDVQIVDRLVDGETYTFLTTGSGLTGTFDTVLGSAFYDFSLMYDANDASLQVTELTYAEVGLSQSEAIFMEELKDMAGHGSTEAQDALAIIFNQDTSSEAKGAIGSLSPQAYSSLVDISMAGYELYGKTVLGRMGNLHLTNGYKDTQYATNVMTENGPALSRIPAFEDQAQGWSSWVRLLAMTGDQDGDNQLSGYDYDTYGVSFGFDNKLNDNLAVGFGAGYANSDVKFKASSQDTDVDSLHLGLYGTHSGDRYYIDTGLFYADSNFDSSRRTAVSSATSSTDGSEWGVYVGGGYTLYETEEVYFMPTASIEYAQVDIDGFSERGTGLLYRVGDYDADSTVTSLGFRCGAKKYMGETRFDPEIRIAWAHEFGDTDRDVKASFIGPPTPTTFTASGIEPDADSVLIGIGVNIFAKENLTVFVDYDGEYRGDFNGHAISGGLRYNF